MAVPRASASTGSSGRSSGRSFRIRGRRPRRDRAPSARRAVTAILRGRAATGGRRGRARLQGGRRAQRRIEGSRPGDDLRPAGQRHVRALGQGLQPPEPARGHRRRAAAPLGVSAGSPPARRRPGRSRGPKGRCAAPAGGRPSVSRMGRDRKGSIGAACGHTPSSSPARISRSARTSRASMAPRIRRRGWLAPPVRTVSPAIRPSSSWAKPGRRDRRQAVALLDQGRRAGPGDSRRQAGPQAAQSRLGRPPARASRAAARPPAGRRPLAGERLAEIQGGAEPAASHGRARAASAFGGVVGLRLPMGGPASRRSARPSRGPGPRRPYRSSARRRRASASPPGPGASAGA